MSSTSVACRVSCDELAHDRAAILAENLFTNTVRERSKLEKEFLDDFPVSEAFDYFDAHEHPWTSINEVFASLLAGNVDAAKAKAKEFMKTAAERHALSEMGLGY